MTWQDLRKEKNNLDLSFPGGPENAGEWDHCNELHWSGET